MQLLKGVNHVAVLTADLDRFIEFYADVFGVEVVFAQTAPAFRHAILRTGPDSWLHPAEVAGNSPCWRQRPRCSRAATSIMWR